MATKCNTCGRQSWTCKACNNRTYCEFCNHCNLHGQEAPAPEMIRPRAGWPAVRRDGSVLFEARLDD